MTVWIVTRGAVVLGAFTDHAIAIDYCEREDVGGSFGTWTDQRYTYRSRHGEYRIWNQEVWPYAAVPVDRGDEGEGE